MSSFHPPQSKPFLQFCYLSVVLALRLLTKFAYLAKTHTLHIRRLVRWTATVCQSHRHRLLFTAKHKSVRVGKHPVLSHSVDYSAALPLYGQSAALLCLSQLDVPASGPTDATSRSPYHWTVTTTRARLDFHTGSVSDWTADPFQLRLR